MEFVAMKEKATIVVRLVNDNPEETPSDTSPIFEVLYVNHTLISEGNLALGERLSDTDLDYLFEVFGDFGVEVIYKR
jgi:hypothetical protein